MIKKYKVAVIGATGVVGRETLEILAERNFPIDQVIAVASNDSLGQKVSFGKVNVPIDVLDDVRWDEIDIIFSSAGAKVTELFMDKVSGNSIVIDKTSKYRLDPQVPLIIPEVNKEEIGLYTQKNIISNPNCCVIPLALTLKPLDSFNKIKRVVVSTYQSMSGAGKSAMETLYEQTKRKFVYLDYSGEEDEDYESDPIDGVNMAFNIIPQIGDISENGYTDEENKIILELGRFLGSDVKVTVTSVRVPVFIGHAFSVNVEFENDFSLLEIESVLGNSESVVLSPAVMTPLDVSGSDQVFVSRIRRDYSAPNSLNMWVVADNLRKGAALNAVQIAENLINLL